MHLNEIELHSISKPFRQAIESADFSEASVGAEGHARMDPFPHGVCSEATTLLGIHLATKYMAEPLVGVIAQIEDNGKWFGSHHWLEHDDIIIDITADQFPMVKNPVLVTRQSEFHSKYAKHIFKDQSRFSLEDQQDWMVNLYNAIINCLQDSQATSGGS